MLNFHDSLQEVYERCTQPTSSRSYTNTQILSAEWTYYIPINNTNTKLTVLFDHGQVTNIGIHASGQLPTNIRSANICRTPIQSGNTMAYVQSACGNPISQITLQTSSVQITELYYEGIKPNTLIFENELLKNWK